MTHRPAPMMTLASAVEAVRLLEPIAARNGGHVALGGGCLHKDGLRKDADLLVYRHDPAVPLRRASFLREAALALGLEPPQAPDGGHRVVVLYAPAGRVDLIFSEDWTLPGTELGAYGEALPDTQEMRRKVLLQGGPADGVYIRTAQRTVTVRVGRVGRNHTDYLYIINGHTGTFCKDSLDK